MILKEYHSTRSDGIKLFRTYSDQGWCIRQQQTGFIYDEAIDVEDSIYTYEETDIPVIRPPEQEATEQDYIDALYELGVY